MLFHTIESYRSYFVCVKIKGKYIKYYPLLDDTMVLLPPCCMLGAPGVSRCPLSQPGYILMILSMKTKIEMKYVFKIATNRTNLHPNDTV